MQSCDVINPSRQASTKVLVVRHTVQPVNAVSVFYLRSRKGLKAFLHGKYVFTLLLCKSLSHC